MCNCKNIELGTYANQVVLDAPAWSSKKVIGVDSCIKDEILDLWSKGIITGGCCCGHNKQDATIAVYEESVQQMKDMEYEVCFNPAYPDDDWLFYAKSVKRININKYGM